MTELTHWGIKGMKWGVRRYENPDGTLTEAGKKRYSKQFKRIAKKGLDEYNSKSTERWVKAHNAGAQAQNKMIKVLDRDQPDLDAKEFNRIVQEAFDKIYNEKINELSYTDFLNNPNVKKSIEIAKKYKLDELDPAIKNDLETVKMMEDEYAKFQKEPKYRIPD